MKILYSVFLIATMMIPLNTCKEQGGSNPQIQQRIDTQVALDFINAYVGNLNSSFPNLQGATGMLDWIQLHPDSSEDLKAALKKMLEEAEKQAPGYGLGFDPILDAQDFPNDGFILREVDSTSGYLTVASPSWEEFKIRMRLKWERGKWWVDGVGIVNIPEEEQAPR